MAYGKSLELAQIRIHAKVVTPHEGLNRKERRTQEAQSRQIKVISVIDKKTGKSTLKAVRRTGSKYYKQLKARKS